MNLNFLDFEQPIAELEAKFTAKIAKVEAKSAKAVEKIKAAGARSSATLVGWSRWTGSDAGAERWMAACT